MSHGRIKLFCLSVFVANARGNDATFRNQTERACRRKENLPRFVRKYHILVTFAMRDAV
jgi:hypothetical protein